MNMCFYYYKIFWFNYQFCPRELFSFALLGGESVTGCSFGSQKGDLSLCRQDMYAPGGL